MRAAQSAADLACRAKHSEETDMTAVHGRPEKLPKDFGGLSGSDLSRIHYRDHGDDKFEITEKRLGASLLGR